MRFLLILSSCFLVSQSILNGHTEEWKKFKHVVKILARSSPASSPFACTGTLISPRLVLTASDCVMEGGKQVSEVLVSIVRSAKPAIRKRAAIAQVNGTIAYLALAHPVPNTELCPSGISSEHVAHLSIVPSLTHAPITPFDWDKIDMTTCRIVGFMSMDNVDEFLASPSASTSVVKVEVDKDALNMRRTHTNLTAPCFEDAGAPLECLVGDKFIQLGLLTSLYGADDGKEHRFKRDDTEVTSTTTTPVPSSEKKEEKEVKTDKTTTTPAPKEEEKADITTPIPTNAPEKDEGNTDVFSRCLNASSLRFSRLDIPSIAAFIEKHDFSGFVKMHEACRQH